MRELAFAKEGLAMTCTQSEHQLDVIFFDRGSCNRGCCDTSHQSQLCFVVYHTLKNVVMLLHQSIHIFNFFVHIGHLTLVVSLGSSPTYASADVVYDRNYLSITSMF